VNDDDFVNSVDSALILQLDAGLIDTLENMESADTSRDDSVNSIDSSLILQHTAGLLAQLNCGDGAGAGLPARFWDAWSDLRRSVN
jgi:hypothetical protein